MTVVLQLPHTLVLDANLFKTLKQTRNLHAIQTVSKLSKDLEIRLITSPLVFGEIVTGGKDLEVPRGFLSVHVEKQEVNRQSPYAKDIRQHANRAGMMPRSEADFELFLLSKEIAKEDGPVGIVTNDEGIHRLVQCCNDIAGEVFIIEPVQMLGHYIRFCEKDEDERSLIKATRDSTEYFIKYRLSQRRDFSTIISALIENMRSGISIQLPTETTLDQSQRVMFAKAVQGLTLSNSEIQTLLPLEGIVNSLRAAMEAEKSQEREYWIGRITTEFILASKDITPSSILPLQREIQTYLLPLHITQFREHFDNGDSKAAISQLNRATIGASLLIGEGGKAALAMLKLLKAILLMALQNYAHIEDLLNECVRLECAPQEVIPLVQYIASLATIQDDYSQIQPPIGEGWEELLQIAEDLQYLGNRSLASRLYASILTHFSLSKNEKKFVALNLLLCERTEIIEETQYLDLLSEYLPATDLKDLTRNKLDSAFRVAKPTPITEIPSIWLEEFYVIDVRILEENKILMRAWLPKLCSRIGIEISHYPNLGILFSKTLKISKGILNRVNVDPRKLKRFNVRAILELDRNAELTILFKKWWLTSLEK